MRWINAHPGNGARLTLVLLPFVLVLAAYIIGSAERLAENPNDKLLPGFAALWEAIDRMALTPDVRTGEYLFWSDTWASLWRLFIGLGIATSIALLLGLIIGILPYARAALSPFVGAISMFRRWPSCRSSSSSWGSARPPRSR